MSVFDLSEYRRRRKAPKKKYDAEEHVFNEDQAYEIAQEKFQELCDFVGNDGLLDKGEPREHHIANLFLLSRYFIQFGLVNFLLSFGTENVNEILFDIQQDLKHIAQQVKDGTLEDES